MTEQELREIIQAARDGCDDEDFRCWAGRWLNGEDRSYEAAVGAWAEALTTLTLLEDAANAAWSAAAMGERAQEPEPGTKP